MVEEHTVFSYSVALPREAILGASPDHDANSTLSINNDGCASSNATDANHQSDVGGKRSGQLGWVPGMVRVAIAARGGVHVVVLSTSAGEVGTPLDVTVFRTPVAAPLGAQLAIARLPVGMQSRKSKMGPHGRVLLVYDAPNEEHVELLFEGASDDAAKEERERGDASGESVASRCGECDGMELFLLALGATVSRQSSASVAMPLNDAELARRAAPFAPDALATDSFSLHLTVHVMVRLDEEELAVTPVDGYETRVFVAIGGPGSEASLRQADAIWYLLQSQVKEGLRFVACAPADLVAECAPWIRPTDTQSVTRCGCTYAVVATVDRISHGTEAQREQLTRRLLRGGGMLIISKEVTRSTTPERASSAAPDPPDGERDRIEGVRLSEARGEAPLEVTRDEVQEVGGAPMETGKCDGLEEPKASVMGTDGVLHVTGEEEHMCEGMDEGQLRALEHKVKRKRQRLVAYKQKLMSVHEALEEERAQLEEERRQIHEAQRMVLEQRGAPGKPNVDDGSTSPLVATTPEKGDMRQMEQLPAGGEAIREQQSWPHGATAGSGAASDLAVPLLGHVAREERPSRGAGTESSARGPRRRCLGGRPTLGTLSALLKHQRPPYYWLAGLLSIPGYSLVVATGAAVLLVGAVHKVLFLWPSMQREGFFVGGGVLPIGPFMILAAVALVLHTALFLHRRAIDAALARLAALAELREETGVASVVPVRSSDHEPPRELRRTGFKWSAEPWHLTLYPAAALLIVASAATGFFLWRPHASLALWYSTATGLVALSVTTSLLACQIAALLVEDMATRLFTSDTTTLRHLRDLHTLLWRYHNLSVLVAEMNHLWMPELLLLPLTGAAIVGFVALGMCTTRSESRDVVSLGLAVGFLLLGSALLFVTVRQVSTSWERVTHRIIAAIAAQQALWAAGAFRSDTTCNVADYSTISGALLSRLCVGHHVHWGLRLPYVSPSGSRTPTSPATSRGEEELGRHLGEVAVTGTGEPISSVQLLQPHPSLEGTSSVAVPMWVAWMCLALPALVVVLGAATG